MSFMNRSSNLSRALAWMSAFAGLSASAQAQTTAVPPVKAGLWEIRMTAEFDGKRNPTLREQIANMQPQQRTAIELDAKRNGASMDGVVTSRFCLSSDKLASGRWHVGGEGCSVAYSSQTSALWKWRATCPRAQSERTAVIQDPEHYTLDTVTTIDRPDSPVHLMHSQETMTWVGADCAGVR